MLARLQDCDAIVNDRTLTDEFVEEIIGDARMVRKVHTIPGTRD